MSFKLTNISSLQIFQLLRYSTLILIGVVFTKTSLTTAEIGEYETFLFLCGAVSFFWLNGLIRGLLPLAKEKIEEKFFSAFVLVSLFTIFVICCLAFINHFGQGVIIKETEIPYSQILLAYLFFSVPNGLIEHFFLLRNQSKLIVRYGVVSFCFMFFAASVPAILGFPIHYSLIGLLITAALRYSYLLYLIVRHVRLKISASFIKEHLSLSSPLILSALLSGSAQYVDGFIVTTKFDEATFAIFRYGARELPLVYLLANAFSTAMLPQVTEKNKLAESLQAIKKESLKMANYLFPLTIVLLFLTHALFPVVFNSNFKESATIFNIYLLLIISRLLFPQTILIGLKKTRAIAIASFFELLLNVSLSLWFVQLWGLAGIAYATVVAYVFEKIILILSVKRVFNIQLTNYLNIPVHLIYSVFLIIVFYIVEFLIY